MSYSSVSMGPTRFRRSTISKVPTALAVVIALSALAAGQGPLDTFRNPRLKSSVGYSMDMEYSADIVLTVVKNVASASVIHGTKIYRKDKDEEIQGAEFASSSKAFNDPPGSGQVFYKVKKGAVAPEHFPGSTGEGTVTVRYIVQAAEGKPIHLRIDAVYVEDSLRARYFSDGTVEAAEYDEIQTQLNAFTAPISASARPDQTGVPAQETTGPQNTLAREQALLAEAKAAEQKLQEQLKQLQFNTQGRVESEGVPLKSYPYNSASTIRTLEKDERATVLATSRYWYRIRTSKGEEGWIYYVFLEPSR
jgi:hypothetical protein